MRYLSAALLALSLTAVSAQDVNSSQDGVLATGTMGSTNPPSPTMKAGDAGSNARLLSVNSIDDFCIFGPKEANKTIGDTEGEQVAWCTQPRNDARLIPDGTFTGVHFITTPFYVQVVGWGDLTKIGLQDADYGGELDPHGATGEGNPIGGNVTSNVSGTDENYAEWMEFISYEQFCLRICTAGNDTWDAATMCEHKLDEMGCGFIMPGDYEQKDVFQSCDADAAYPPGMFSVAGDGDNSFSSFAQRYTGTLTQEGQQTVYTIGDTATPSSAQMTPSSSNCRTQSSLNAAQQPTSTSSNEGDEGSKGQSQDDDSAAATLQLVSAWSIAVIAVFAVLL
ncbi:hypothetical protein E3P98_01665 [Wallemia ichthyophaga]|nr:hypothetical protein E3P98_01665 [Wallemia ichthyophaga]